MRAGSAHTSERRRSDGRVIELRGQPLPDGGFVTTFSDVTSHKRTEESLREINETLELRVEERTRQLAAAVAQAEQANQSKTRFVVAASHDLLQPLGAARLFNAALRSRAGVRTAICAVSPRASTTRWPRPANCSKACSIFRDSTPAACAPSSPSSTSAIC